MNLREDKFIDLDELRETLDIVYWAIIFIVLDQESVESFLYGLIRRICVH